LDREGLVALLNRRGLVTLLDGGSLVALLDCERFVVLDGRGAIVTDIARFIVLDFGGHIFLGVNEKLFLALVVLEANLVEIVGTAAFRTAALDSALGLICRQCVGWHQVGIVRAADCDGLIGISFQE